MRLYFLSSVINHAAFSGEVHRMNQDRRRGMDRGVSRRASWLPWTSFCAHCLLPFSQYNFGAYIIMPIS